MNSTEQTVTYKLWDGLGGYVDVPAGTIVGCNQIGHNYHDHLITDHCGVGSVIQTVRYCASCGEPEGSDYAKRCCTEEQMLEETEGGEE